ALARASSEPPTNDATKPPPKASRASFCQLMPPSGIDAAPENWVLMCLLLAQLRAAALCDGGAGRPIDEASLFRVKEDFTARLLLFDCVMHKACFVDERDRLALAHALAGMPKRRSQVGVDDAIDATAAERPRCGRIELQLADDLAEPWIGRDDEAVA